MTRNQHNKDWQLAKSLNNALDLGLPTIKLNQAVIAANELLDGDILAGLCYIDVIEHAVSIPDREARKLRDIRLAKDKAESIRNRPVSN